MVKKNLKIINACKVKQIAGIPFSEKELFFRDVIISLLKETESMTTTALCIKSKRYDRYLNRRWFSTLLWKLSAVYFQNTMSSTYLGFKIGKTYNSTEWFIANRGATNAGRTRTKKYN